MNLSANSFCWTVSPCQCHKSLVTLTLSLVTLTLSLVTLTLSLATLTLSLVTL